MTLPGLQTGYQIVFFPQELFQYFYISFLSRQCILAKSCSRLACLCLGSTSQHAYWALFFLFVMLFPFFFLIRFSSQCFGACSHSTFAPNLSSSHGKSRHIRTELFRVEVHHHVRPDGEKTMRRCKLKGMRFTGENSKRCGVGKPSLRRR